jgi:hypothetical protein
MTVDSNVETVSRPKKKKKKKTSLGQRPNGDADGADTAEQVDKHSVPNIDNHNIHRLPYTPFKNNRNPNDPSKPRLQDQSPLSQTILAAAVKFFQVHVATEDPFSAETDRMSEGATAFVKACTLKMANRRALRFEREDECRKVMLKLVSASRPQRHA